MQVIGQICAHCVKNKTKQKTNSVALKSSIGILRRIDPDPEQTDFFSADKVRNFTEIAKWATTISMK